MRSRRARHRRRGALSDDHHSPNGGRHPRRTSRPAGALAEQSVRAAETHEMPSPQHDAAMDAHAEYQREHALEPGARS
jgi:hypothetical protein